MCEFNKNINCPCKSDRCPNHAKCCACVAAHRTRGNLPVCLRQKVDEASKPDDGIAVPI